VLRRAGLSVTTGVLAAECESLNEAFNHWIVHHTPFVTVKAAMTLDGKIATASGGSKWITGEAARAHAMELRRGADAILVGINTVLADDPSLTVRPVRCPHSTVHSAGYLTARPGLRRFVLDSLGRTPLKAKLVCDQYAPLTTIVVSDAAPRERVNRLEKRVRVLIAPLSRRNSLSCTQRLDLHWLLKWLGGENIISLLVEGGGEVNASFLLAGLAHRIAFYYAPRILGGRDSRKAVAGHGARTLKAALHLDQAQWRRLEPDWLLEAHVAAGTP
jgi:diaminohydroxyphosphoribosylaminopyrimidine deaminase/5-amino-6-(5-phosphoribosylamino)uracil reductase